jgi:ferric-dicitrate binding protein FerR (iron transport regulator)
VEACPASTLKRLGLPHNNYKQPGAAPLEPKRRRARRAILCGLAQRLVIGPGQRRLMWRDPGGDALDAVIAALGGAQAWRLADHRHIARHPRYPREGRLFV